MLTEKWYMSVAASLTEDSLSWVGHGLLGETKFLYLETVRKNSDTATYEHLSLLLFDLGEIAADISAADDEGAYPVSLIKRSNE